MNAVRREDLAVGDLVYVTECGDSNFDEQWHKIAGLDESGIPVRVEHNETGSPRWLYLSNIKAKWVAGMALAAEESSGNPTTLTAQRYRPGMHYYASNDQPLLTPTGRRYANGPYSRVRPALDEPAATTPRQWTTEDFTVGDLVYVAERPGMDGSAGWARVDRVDITDTLLPLLVRNHANSNDIWRRLSEVTAKWEDGQELAVTDTATGTEKRLTATARRMGLTSGHEARDEGGTHWTILESIGAPWPGARFINPKPVASQGATTTPQQSEVERLEAEKAALQAQLDQVRQEAQQFRDRTVETATQYVRSNGSDFREGVEEILNGLGLSYPTSTIDKMVTVTFRLQAEAVDHDDTADWDVQNALTHGYEDSDEDNGEKLAIQMYDNWTEVDFSQVSVVSVVDR